MKTFNYLVLGLILILLAPGERIVAQSSRKDQSYFGFDSLGWKRISKRYERKQPRVNVLLNDGRTSSGQIIFTGENDITVYPGYDIVMQESLSDSFNIIDFGEIQQIKIERNAKPRVGMISGMVVGGGAAFFPAFALAWGGADVLSLLVLGGGIAGGGITGNAIQKKSQSRVIKPDDFLDISSKRMSKLQNWSVFQDSIVYPGDFRELLKSSKSMQHSFPNKNIRISAITSIKWKGLDTSANLEELFEPAVETIQNQYNHSRRFMSFGASYKLNDNFYLGADWFQSDIAQDPYFKLSDSINYRYSMWYMRGLKLYAEYTPLVVDRYFITRTEILLGAGLLFSNTLIEKGWSVEHSDGTFSYGHTTNKYNIKGLHARVSANIYATPWLSFSLGIEANFLQDITIPEVHSLKSDYTYTVSDIDYFIPEHSISFDNDFKILVGSHLHF